MLQKESKLFINTVKGILYTTLLALTTIGGVYAADPVNICPQQKVEVNKTYYNIEGNCNSTGEVYKYIGTTLSSDVFGSVIVESTPRNTELLTLFKPESVNGDYYEAGKYSVKLTCKKNEVSSTNSFDIDLKNY
ncbi:MAG: hypothetical protein QM532_00675 [Cyanobium sp. MAG06]|nr:hypothetical protein [Cyanobium sp. MAG06]